MARVEIPSDLMSQVANRDEKAFETLYRLTYRPLFSFLLSLTADQEKARDLMQETYLKVFTSAHMFRNPGNPLSWIMKIGKNLFLMEKRSKDSNLIYLEDTEQRFSGITFDVISDIETRETLRSLFEILDLQERTIVILHDLSGFRHREIAGILELPTGTVLSKYNRAIRKMREKARAEEGSGDKD